MAVLERSRAMGRRLLLLVSRRTIQPRYDQSARHCRPRDDSRVRAVSDKSRVSLARRNHITLAELLRSLCAFARGYKTSRKGAKVAKEEKTRGCDGSFFKVNSRTGCDCWCRGRFVDHQRPCRRGPSDTMGFDARQGILSCAANGAGARATLATSDDHAARAARATDGGGEDVSAISRHAAGTARAVPANAACDHNCGM